MAALSMSCCRFVCARGGSDVASVGLRDGAAVLFSSPQIQRTTESNTASSSSPAGSVPTVKSGESQRFCDMGCSKADSRSSNLTTTDSRQRYLRETGETFRGDKAEDSRRFAFGRSRYSWRRAGDSNAWRRLSLDTKSHTDTPKPSSSVCRVKRRRFFTLMLLRASSRTTVERLVNSRSTAERRALCAVFCAPLSETITHRVGKYTDGTKSTLIGFVLVESDVRLDSYFPDGKTALKESFGEASADGRFPT